MHFYKVLCKVLIKYLSQLPLLYEEKKDNL